MSPPNHPGVAAVGSAFPPNYYDQDALLAALREHWGRQHYNPARLEQIHRNVAVGGRHLALPLPEYAGLQTWGQANDAWIRVGEEVGAEALDAALRKAGVEPQDVGALFTVTVTGISTPSLDVKLIQRLQMSPATRRIPIFGLGCVAGAAGISRAVDWVRAYPDSVAVLLSVELCSLTLQRQDLSIPNLIASGLFGDGAAAAVVTGGARDEPGPRVLATRSELYPESERVMGWDISESGFRIVLSAEVPDVVRRYLGRDVDAFLGEHDLSRSDIGVWICHPGGPKVLQAMGQTLGLSDEALQRTWRSLREVGNLSSTSVLLVLEETLTEEVPRGTFGVMLAMGPGFCSELVLLQF